MIATLPSANPALEGVTTTQINVRSEPSTIGDSLGIISPSSKIQILGRESNGTWYLIRYDGAPDGNGWVSSAYVQVDESMDIPVVRMKTGSGPGISGLVILPVNVRRGPGTSFASIGQLNANDVVTITGRDSSSAWMQIAYKDEAGWIASEFLKADGVDSLPVTFESTPASATKASPEGTSIPSLVPSFQDGDSMQLPLVSVLLSREGVQEFEFSGNISIPDLDPEDWIQFSSDDEQVFITAECDGIDLTLELWDGRMILDKHALDCGTVSGFTTRGGKDLLLHILNASGENPGNSHYKLKAEIIRP